MITVTCRQTHTDSCTLTTIVLIILPSSLYRDIIYSTSVLVSPNVSGGGGGGGGHWWEDDTGCHRPKDQCNNICSQICEEEMSNNNEVKNSSINTINQRHGLRGVTVVTDRVGWVFYMIELIGQRTHSGCSWNGQRDRDHSCTLVAPRQ